MTRLFFTLLTLALFCFQLTSQATIRRVGFTQSLSPVNGLDYASFQAAHDAAVTGDTIQLYPSTVGTSYSGTVNKRLVILGPGYYVNTYDLPSSGIFNTQLQNLPGYISSSSFTVGVGSSGTIFQGINYLRITTSNVLDSLNDITISRSRYVNVTFDNSGVCNNWVVSQCYAASIQQSGFGLSFSANRSITNLRVENTVGPTINFTASGPQSPVGVNSGQILNCVWAHSATGVDYVGGGLRLNNGLFVVQNCIDAQGMLYVNGMTGISNTIFVNNMTSVGGANNPVATNPGSSGNIFNVNFAGNSIFAGYPNNQSGSTILYSSDAAFQLSNTSQAKGAGIIPGTTTATDLGIYGGTNPYKTSGMAAVPSFYKLNAPSSTATTSPYTLTFSVRSNN